MDRIRFAIAVAICTALFVSRAHAGPDTGLSEHLFDDANGAFLGGDLNRATAAWQALVEEGVASVELETNLGTALLRDGKRGEAALHFERALYLEPGDDDARANLTELRRSNVDKLEGESDEGADTLLRLFAPIPGGAAAILLVASWALACFFFGLRTWSPSLQGNRSVGNAALIALLLALISGAATAASAEAHKLALQRAVMIASSTPAREGPQAKANSTFEVHEGTPVRIEDEAAGFIKIKLQNGLTGWVPRDSLARVVPAKWGGLE